MALKEGDTVRCLHNGKLATVKKTGVDKDVEVEDFRRMTRLPEGNTLILFHWKPGGGCSYEAGPKRFMVCRDEMLSKK